MGQDNVLTSSVWEAVTFAESQSFQEKYYGEHYTITSQKGSHTSFLNQCMCKNSGVSQWVAYGNVAVKRHRQQDPWLIDECGMDEEQLSDTAIQGDLPRMEPKDGQLLRYYAHGEDNVCSSQLAEEEVHGFMEPMLGEDNEDE